MAIVGGGIGEGEEVGGRFSDESVSDEGVPDVASFDSGAVR